MKAALYVNLLNNTHCNKYLFSYFIQKEVNTINHLAIRVWLTEIIKLFNVIYLVNEDTGMCGARVLSYVYCQHLQWGNPAMCTIENFQDYK